jgi:hypothetical protein
MKGQRREYAKLDHERLRRANLRNVFRTSFSVNQVPRQRLFAESFEERARLVP